MASDTLIIEDLLEDRTRSPYHWWVVALCTMVTAVDGFDAQAGGFAAPMITKAWQMGRGDIGIALAATGFGGLLGATLIGPLGDRLGRRRLMLVSLLMAGAMTLGTGLAGNMWELCFARFLTGVGLGVGMPNISALTLEFLPTRRRALGLVLVSCGYPFGAGVGGAVAGVLDRGWQGIFLLAGAATLVAWTLATVLLPESPVFLAFSESNRTRLLRTLRAIFPRREFDSDQRFAIAQKHIEPPAVERLFTPERRVPTLLLWLVFFAASFAMYFFITWLPSLFTYRGLPVKEAIAASSVFNMGSVVGGLAIALLLGRYKSTLVLSGALLAGAAAMFALGSVTGSGPLLTILVFAAGACGVGAQFSMPAIVGAFYPSSLRVTGLGFAGGAGRIGSLAAPLIGGALINAMPDMQQTFRITAVSVLAAAIALSMLVLYQRLRGERLEQTAQPSN